MKAATLLRQLIWTILIAIPCVSYAQQESNYEITGKLEGIPNVSTIYLHYANGYKAVTDSARVVNNTYTLRGHTEVGQNAFLICFELKDIADPKKVVPNGLVKIFLSPEKFKITHTNQFNNIIITGSTANNDYTELMTTISSHKDDPSYKEVVLEGFIKTHPRSSVAFAALTELAGTGHQLDGLLLKPYYDSLPEEIKQSEAGQIMNKRITTAVKFATKGAIGSPVSDFTLPDTAGHLIKLSDVKGKYILIDFWASWCTPCRADNPYLVAAYNKFHSKGFNIISVSLDIKAREEAWHKAIIHDHLIAWTHVADLEHISNAAADLYGVQSIPQNFLIGPDGKIIARSLHGDELEKKLTELLSN